MERHLKWQYAWTFSVSVSGCSHLFVSGLDLAFWTTQAFRESCGQGGEAITVLKTKEEDLVTDLVTVSNVLHSSHVGVNAEEEDGYTKCSFKLTALKRKWNKRTLQRQT